MSENPVVKISAVHMLFKPTVVPEQDRPPFKSTRLLDQLRERIRYLHYSLRTEEVYVYWARDLIHWSGLRHPRALGSPDV